MSGRVHFNLEMTATGPLEQRPPRSDTALRILLMGDFAGRANLGLEDHAALVSRRPLPVDVDNFAATMTQLAPRIRLPVGAGGADATLDLLSIDDFHPDSLYRRLPLFSRLRDARRQLQDAATFPAAAERLRLEAQDQDAALGHAGVGQSAQEPEHRSETDADTLTRLLGSGSSRSASEPRQDSAEGRLDALIRSIVAPHIVPEAPPHQAQYVAAVDFAIGEQMRAILHHPQFQSLEAAWRGLQWLVSNLETNELLRLDILDVSQAELAADMRAARGDVAGSALHRLLVDAGRDTESGAPWSLLIGNFEFGLAGEDVSLLAWLGVIASAAGGPFIAGAKPELLGCDSIVASPDPRDWTPPVGDVAEGWAALRASRMAPWIGLVLPRLLMRLPYGRGGEAVESFAFDEHGPTPRHEDFLWGNGALACALLIGRAFAARGWDMALGDELEIDDLPACVLASDGETRLQPCAEVRLVERAAERVADAGLMPLLSDANRNAARLLRFQSIATPVAALAGPWR